MPRPLKQGILGASKIILSKEIDKYAFMSGSNFYEKDVNWTFQELEPVCCKKQQKKFLTSYWFAE